MKVKALITVKYAGKRYSPGSVFVLTKNNESLAKSKSLEIVPDEKKNEEKAEVSRDKTRGDNENPERSQRRGKTPKDN